MRDLLNYIPGFRSRKLWKTIIASLYYLISLTALVDSIGLFLIMLSIPFVIFGITGLFRNRNKKALVTFIIPILIFSLGVSTMPPTQEASIADTGIRIEEVEQANDKIDNTNVKATTTTTTTTALVTEVTPTASVESVNADSTIPVIEGNLEVHFIDVGQADSILIKTPTGENMLVDAGNNGDGDLVYSYLKNQEINTIDVLIGTHPHEDHIGGLDTIINNVTINKVYMPKVSHTTKTFEDVLLAIQNKGLKITTPIAGDTFNLGAAKFTILAPNSSSYDDLNNYSIVLKLEYGVNSFLFTGDSENISENEMITKGYDLKVDVLKIGHHGSDLSTKDSFLKTIAPTHAIISVGKNNQYGHPDSTVLQKLKDNNVSIYRTDEAGTIIATSDGKNISINKNASTIVVTAPPISNTQTSQVSKPVTPPATDNIQEVYITKTGSKYHLGSCSYLSKSKIPISLVKAKAGYGPCSRCKPPQ